MVDAQTISMVFGGLSVGVAAIYYIITLRSNNKTRQAQLLMQIYDKVNNRDFTRDWGETNYFWKWNDSKEYFKKYGTNLAEYPKFQNIIDTYEGIGVILQNKLIDPKLIYGVLRVQPILYWEKFSPMMKEFGAEAGESLMYPGFEFLCKELNNQYEFEHGYKFGHKIRHADELLAIGSGASKVS
jgi:hypothetical protein